MLLSHRKFLHLNHTLNNNNNNNVTTTSTNTVATSINTGGDIMTHSSSSSSSSSSFSSASETLGEERVRDIHEGNSYSPTCCFNSFRLNPPFDSAMALTVLVLLTALFFMGFFSIYIRRFADENSVDPRRRRRLGAAAAHLSPFKKGGKGVDPEIVESLPTYLYVGRDVEKGEEEEERECAICLGEFEEGDKVKNIPFCGHVFHVTCIDTWLESHVTCPLCRTAKFFPAVPAEKEVAVNNTSASTHVSRRGSDTCREHEGEVGPTCMRRTSSWSWDGHRVALHRSLSF